MDEDELQSRVLDIISKNKPKTIGILLDTILVKGNEDREEIIANLRGMVARDQINVIRSPPKGRIQPLLLKMGFLGRFVMDHLDDPLVKVTAFIIFWNLVSLGALVFISPAGVFGTARAILLLVDLFFIPGFSLTIAWYPLKSSKFKPKPKKSPPLHAIDPKLAARNTGDGKNMDAIARIAYSAIYSIGLCVLFGFLVNILGFGFNLLFMHVLVTLIEMMVILGILKVILTSLDPYRMI